MVRLYIKDTRETRNITAGGLKRLPAVMFRVGLSGFI